MTTVDLPTDRLRQLRDGHNPDDAHTGRARADRITRLQTQIVEADERVRRLRHYRAAARRIDTDPLAIREVDRLIRTVEDETITERDRLTIELRALQ